MDVGLLLQHSQYAVPVGIVLLCAVLVFVFGFKKAEQPPFAQLAAASDVDRKLVTKKRGKIREKRSANGQVTAEKASPVKKTVPAKAEKEALKKTALKTEDVEGKLKERKQEDNKVSIKKDKAGKENNQVVAKAGKENKVEQTKNKKNLKNLKNIVQEKPVDFDDGDWEQAYSRKDKKNKKKEEDSPTKKSKKSNKKTELINEVATKEKETEKLTEKPEIKDKVAKENENKELKEKEKKEVILTPISNEGVTNEKELQKEEESTKVEKAEKEEKKSGKSKKAKKVSEGESTPASIPTTPKADNKQPPATKQPAEKEVDSVEKIADNSEVQIATKVAQTPEKTGAVFDELGDVWTEAKPQKKSKKKARKDN